MRSTQTESELLQYPKERHVAQRRQAMAEKTADELAEQIEHYLDSQTQGLDDAAYVAVMQKVSEYVEARIDNKSGAKPTRKKKG